MTTQILTQQKLKERLDYNPNTGLFTWRVAFNSRSTIGSIAGSYSNGYRVIRINRKNYHAHRLAWLYTHGQFPQNQLDHINRIRDDNRINNLREVTNAQNHQNRNLGANNISGVCGVNWHKRDKKWRAYIKLNGKDIHLGQYDDMKDAIVARKQAEQTYHLFRAN
jgi:hypothetical protein